MEESTRIVQLGLGPIGESLVRLASSRRGLEVVGAVDLDPTKVGRTLGEVAGVKNGRVTIRSDLAAVLAETRAQVVLQATGSSLAQVLPQLETAVRAGTSVVSTSEELVYPHWQDRELANALDDLAKRHGVAVLGAGVNPGFAMDVFPLLISGVCEEVVSITVRRVQEAGNRRRPLQLKIGAGGTVDEFRAGVQLGTIGHIGLRVSAAMLADAIGWRIESVEETIDPVIATAPASTPYVQVAAGGVSGVQQVLTARTVDREVIRLELLMHIGVDEPRDEVEVVGTPPLRVTALGGFPGDAATAAIVVNSIPRVLSALPGLHSSNELPLPHFTLEGRPQRSPDA